MLAAFFNYENSLEVRNTPDPKPKPGEALIKVDTALICQKDLAILSGAYPTRPPIILGHEFSGRVVEFGSPIPQSQAKQGQLVAVDPYMSCGQCRYCLTGQGHLCPGRHSYGSFFNGGFAQYVCVSEAALFPVDEQKLNARSAALAEPLACCLRAVDAAEPRRGDICVVMGCNTEGMIFAKLLRQAGVASIIVCDENERRRDAALYYGADVVTDMAGVREAVMSATGGHGADVVIDCDPEIRALETSYTLGGRGARLVLATLLPPGKKISVEPHRLMLNSITVRASYSNFNKQYSAMELLPTLGLAELVTHTFTLDKINEAMDTARKGVGFKIAITPNPAERQQSSRNTMMRRRSVTLRIPKPGQESATAQMPDPVSASDGGVDPIPGLQPLRL